MSPEKRIADLADTFPSLRTRKASTMQEMRAIASQDSQSHGAKHAALFCMSVYNFSRNSFNLGAAWGGWDNAHRDAWKAWARDPWFC